MAEVVVPAPNPQGETGVTSDMVRHFIWDRTIEDNPLELDLEFSDAEIGYARNFAIMAINAVPPFVITLTNKNVPKTMQYPFLTLTAYHLMIAKMMQLARKDIDYSAGNMSVDINKRRIDFLSKWAPALKAEADTLIKTTKVTMNLEGAYMTESAYTYYP